MDTTIAMRPGHFAMRLSHRLFIPMGGLLLALPSIQAQQTPPPKEPAQEAPASKETPREPPKDYSKGFEKFLQFGLPDVKDAAYMKLEAGGQEGFSSFGEEPRMDGNAWQSRRIRSWRGNWPIPAIWAARRYSGTAAGCG